MSRNKQSRKYLIGRSYKKDEFDWPFDLVTVTWKYNPKVLIVGTFFREVGDRFCSEFDRFGFRFLQRPEINNSVR